VAKHRARSTNKLAGGLLLGAAASGAVAVALSEAGAANATCASISGVGNTANCISAPGSFAYAQGPNTVAETEAGNLNLAAAVGSNNEAFAGFSPNDNGNVALNLSNNTNGSALSDFVEAGGNTTLGQSGSANIAANLGGVPTATSESVVTAVGNGNSAFNLLGNGNSNYPWTDV